MPKILKNVTRGKKWTPTQKDAIQMWFADGERPFVVAISEDNELIAYDAGIKRPYSAPTIAAAAGTNLTAGSYDVGYAFYRTLDNTYSDVSPTASVTISAGANEAILVSDFHAPENKAWPLTDTIDQIRLFISPPNFGQLYFPNSSDSIADIKTLRRSDVATTGELPGFGITDGEIRRVAADNRLYKATDDSDLTGTINTVFFSGSGLNDATSNSGASGYTGTDPATFLVIIDSTSGSPDTFKWNKDGGSFTTGVSCAAGAHALSGGVEVTFNAPDGHTVGDSWTITAGVSWATLRLTYDTVDTTLTVGTQADLFEWQLLPGVRKGVTVGDRIIIGSQSTRTGVGSCTITNETFAGKSRAKVVLTSDTVVDGMMWRKFVVNGIVIGRVYYTDASPFDGTVFYLKGTWNGETITAATDYRWEGDQFIWGTANINLAVGNTIVQTPFPQSFNPDSFIGPELGLGDQDEIRDIVQIGNSCLIYMDTKVHRLDVSLGAGSFRDVGVAGFLTIERGLGAISYFSGAKMPGNSVLALTSDGIIGSNENSVVNLTDSTFMRTYFRDSLNAPTFENARGVFVKTDQTDYYVLFYMKDDSDSTNTQCVFFDIKEGRIIPYDIGRIFTEVIQINDSDSKPVQLYGDSTGNIGFFLKASTFTNNGTNYTTYWQSGAMDFEIPYRKAIYGIKDYSAFKDSSYSLTMNIYPTGAVADIDSLGTAQTRTITQREESFRVNFPYVNWSELFVLRLTANAADWPKYISHINFDVQPIEVVR